jgi:hypothetical protein
MKKIKKWLYMAGLLCMSVSCKKDDPCGGQNACCGAPDQKMTYRTTVENAKADSWGRGLVIEYKNVRYPTIFCYQQDEIYDGKLKITYIEGEPQPFKYRVWGTVYGCGNCPVYIKGGELLYFQIDKIEYQN